MNNDPFERKAAAAAAAATTTGEIRSRLDAQPNILRALRRGARERSTFAGSAFQTQFHSIYYQRAKRLIEINGVDKRASGNAPNALTFGRYFVALAQPQMAE